MRKDIINDELNLCADIISPLFQEMKKRKYQKKKRDFCFAGDSNCICDYLLYAVAMNNAKYSLVDKIVYLENGAEDEYRKDILGQIEVEKNKENIINGDYFIFVSSNDMGVAELERVLNLIPNTDQNRCIVTVLLPEYPAYEGKITEMAEREFSYFLEMQEKKTKEIKSYLQIEELCRSTARNTKIGISLLRYSNVFAPERVHMYSNGLDEIIRKCYIEKQIQINETDENTVISLSYVRNACYTVFKAMEYAQKGNIYNADSMTVTIAQLKRNIYDVAENEIGLYVDVPPVNNRKYYGLSSLKIKNQGIQQETYLNNGIKHIFSCITGCEYNNSDNVEFYGGKIEIIRELELEILKEIERICRKYKIQYFLAGGTLLGAVRNGKCISWDDDLDIGMLREDYEKFRKVCEKELKDEFLYSRPKTGSHYTIEKIRLKDTFFSTKISRKNMFQDGVFVDLLVYDKTSNIRVFQKIHSMILTILTTVINIRWFNKPQRGYHYWFAKCMLPFLRVIPWNVYHKLFDYAASIYKKKKNAKWLIDSVGKKVNGNPMPNQGLDEVRYIDFEGMKVPVPANPEPYLNYAYGPDYIQMPCVSKRRCPHDWARIDLGQYVNGSQNAKMYHEIDLRGELYEDA